MPSTAVDGSLNCMTWFSKKSAAESNSLDSTWASLALGSSAKGSKARADLGDPLPMRVTPSARSISRAVENDSTYFNAFSCNQKANLVTTNHGHFTSLHEYNLKAQGHVCFGALLDNSKDAAHQTLLLHVLVERRHRPHRRDHK